tara:strand:- start:87 stop:290 length:204 start_codon:yes stop_codon:yes gene_type:complete
MIILINMAYRLVILGIVLLAAPILAVVAVCAYLLIILSLIGFVLTKPVLETTEDNHYVSWSRGYYHE